MLELASAANPEFYAELLSLKLCGGPGRSPAVDTAKLDSRLISLVNSIARLVVSQRGQVAAVAVKSDLAPSGQSGRADTTIYITYNRNLTPVQHNAVMGHVQDLLACMHQIPLPSDNESSPPLGTLPPHTMSVISEMLTKIYTFSIHILLWSIAKRHQTLLSAIALTQNRANLDPEFSDTEWSTIEDVFVTLAYVERAVKESDIPSSSGALQLLYKEYKGWVKAGYMSSKRNVDEFEDMDEDMDEDEDEDHGEDDEDQGEDLGEAEGSGRPNNLIARLERSIQKQSGIYFPVEKWIRKLVSLHICCLRLVRLSVSRRLRTLMEGSVTVEILPALSPPYSVLHVDLSDKAVSDVISVVQRRFKDKSVGGTTIGQHDDMAQMFIKDVLEKLDYRERNRLTGKLKPPRRDPKLHRAEHKSPYVHCEVGLACHIQLHKLAVFGYIGVSRLSCDLCQLYLDFHSQPYQPLRTLGSHNKFYPNWVFPRCDPRHDEAVWAELVEKLQERLADMLANYIVDKKIRRLSDSTAASDSSSIDIADHSNADIEMELRTLNQLRDELYGRKDISKDA